MRNLDITRVVREEQSPVRSCCPARVCTWGIDTEREHDPGHCYRGPPISARTFEGSFSAVWVPTIARVGAFFHIFRDLQDSHSFAPLHTQIFVNFSFLFLQFFPPNFIIFANFESISLVFEQILMKICRNFTGLKNASQNFGEISNFDELGVRGLPKKLK